MRRSLSNREISCDIMGFTWLHHQSFWNEITASLFSRALDMGVRRGDSSRIYDRKIQVSEIFQFTQELVKMNQMSPRCQEVLGGCALDEVFPLSSRGFWLADG